MSKIHRDKNEPGACPACGSPHGGLAGGYVGYSAPLTAVCDACGETWTFGEKIKVLTLEEARKKRPWLYGGGSG